MSSAKEKPPILAVEGIAKAFSGFRAVDDVSFSVRAGELLALIGPNGAGKTTTFNMINGQLRPDRGVVRLDGEDITGASPQSLWQRGIGRTFQISSTFASMTVGENVGVALIAAKKCTFNLSPALMGRFEDEIRARLTEVGLAAAMHRQCGTLAYGDIKRLELAMALSSHPRLMLMDEPTAGMAPAERTSLMQLVAGLVRQHGTAVLFTEHDMDVVFGNADRIIVMNRGRLIASGSADQIRRDPQVREVYLGGGKSGSF